MVKPIHEKAMPVLLLTPEETDIWMRAVRSQRYQGEDRHDESEIR
ncbi:hypothetical protein [Rhizobium sp. 42MFCr.1]|nr:hypothetical protein [Rhizobium sp. 42MFCr.1]